MDSAPYPRCAKYAYIQFILQMTYLFIQLSLSIFASSVMYILLSFSFCALYIFSFLLRTLLAAQSGRCDVDRFWERQSKAREGWLQHVLGHVCCDRYAYIVLSSCCLQTPPHHSDWL